jgi:hypothetical protein
MGDVLLKHKRLLLLFALLPVLLPAGAQAVSFGIKFSGLAIHPRPQPVAGQYGGRLDRKGYAVVTQGLALTVDVNLYRNVGLKLIQALVWRDCANKFAMLSHVGVNFFGAGTTLGKGRHGFSWSLGPVLYRRQSWKDVPGYVPDDSWLKAPAGSRWETKLVLLGGQLEYNYYFRENYGLSLNVLPGYPDVISVSGGVGRRSGFTGVGD